MYPSSASGIDPTLGLAGFTLLCVLGLCVREPQVQGQRMVIK